MNNKHNQTDRLKTNRLYSDLAWLWPVWGEPEEYAPYCENITKLIKEHAHIDVIHLLNLCCGGGKNVFNLKKHFIVTGLDLSSDMLDLARRLNPECHFIQADIRDYSLPDRYDAILIDDGIAYITNEADLRLVFKRAYEHLKPGGVMIVGPDDVRETFIQNETVTTRSSSKNRSRNLDVVFIENDYDPDPADSETDALIIYIIRENGKLRIEHDMHHLGLFSTDTWRSLVNEVGFLVQESDYSENGKSFLEFVCVKPG